MDPKVEEALDDEEGKKRNRKRILLYEIEGTKYWEQVYKDTDCQFDINKLYIQKEFDIFQYEVYAETGDFPTKKERNAKIKELKEKYKK